MWLHESDRNYYIRITSECLSLETYGEAVHFDSAVVGEGSACLTRATDDELHEGFL